MHGCWIPISLSDVLLHFDRCAKLAENAKKKGNAAFSKGDYVSAIKSYSMVTLPEFEPDPSKMCLITSPSQATRLDKNNHTVFSNLSASYAQVRRSTLSKSP